MSLPSRTSSVSSSDGRPDLSAIGKILGAGDDSQVPKLGKTRCYWALLTSDLDFLYLDPVLQHHMGPEHQVMLGTSLLSYLHPAELEQARKDLRGIVDSGTLFGSVTRVRFARLSHMRKLLGANEPEVPENAATFCSDDKFIALDLVINAAGEGLVLAFFHSIIDKQQKDDQDELRKSEWTNWCGTPFITQDMIKLLWEKVSTVHLPPLPRAPAFPPQRVFQIHLASSEHEILLTHPPARPMPLNDGPPLLDGGYQEEEFQRLLEQISLNPQGGSPFSEAKTTCTRRFRAKHTLLTEGCFRTIESVFIPYGTLIFACFQTKHQEWLPPSAGPQAGPRPPQIGYNSQQQHQHQQQQQQLAMNHSNQHNASPYPPPPPANHSWNSQPAAAIGYGGAPPWPGTPVASTTSSNGPSGYGYSVSSSYGGDQHPYRVHHQHQQPGPPPPQQQQQQHQPPHVLPPPPTDGYSQQRFESTSPPPGPEFSQDDHHDSAQEGTNGSPSSQNPVPRKAAIPITRPNKSMRGGSGGGSLSASGLPKLPEQLRNGGKPPKGISCCASCGTTDSAEWRKGESGQKDLCNACGLRYARIVAKQSGKVRARKKKDKNGNDIQPKQLPPSSTTAATSSSNTGRSDSDGSSGQPPAKKARGRGAASTTSPLPPPSVPGPLTDGSNASSSYPGAELTSSSMSYHHSGHPLSNSPYPPSGSYRPSPHHAAFQIAPPPPPPLPPPSSHPNHPYPAALAQPHDSYVPSPHQQQHAAYAQPPPPAHHHPYNEYEAAPGSLYKPYGGGPGGDGGQPHQPHRPHLQQQPHQAGIPPPLQQYPPHPTPPPPPPPLSPHPPHPPHPPPPQQQQQSSYSPYGGGHPNYHPTQPHPQAHRQRQQPLHHSGGYQPPPPPPISNGGGYPTYTNNGNGGGYDRHRLHHQSHSDGGGPGPASHQYPGMGYAQPGYGPGPGSYASGGRGETGPGSAGERAG